MKTAKTLPLFWLLAGSKSVSIIILATHLHKSSLSREPLFSEVLYTSRAI